VKGRWINSSQCVWDGPAYLTVKSALLPALSWANTPILTAFFVESLGVSNVSVVDLLGELEGLKMRSFWSLEKCSIVETENIQSIYARLQDMISSLQPPEIEIMR
jgi:hypothetical protein